jgi:hypothetical protein
MCRLQRAEAPWRNGLARSVWISRRTGRVKGCDTNPDNPLGVGNHWRDEASSQRNETRRASWCNGTMVKSRKWEFVSCEVCSHMGAVRGVNVLSMDGIWCTTHGLSARALLGRIHLSRDRLARTSHQLPTRTPQQSNRASSNVPKTAFF